MPSCHMISVLSIVSVTLHFVLLCLKMSPQALRNFAGQFVKNFWHFSDWMNWHTLQYSYRFFLTPIFKLCCSVKAWNTQATKHECCVIWRFGVAITLLLSTFGEKAGWCGCSTNARSVLDGEFNNGHQYDVILAFLLCRCTH